MTEKRAANHALPGAWQTYGDGEYHHRRKVTAWIGPESGKVNHLELDVRAFPVRLELFVYELRVIGAVLRTQGFTQAKERAWVARVAVKVFTKDFFRFSGVPVQQQHGAQRFAHRIEPVRRLVIL